MEWSEHDTSVLLDAWGERLQKNSNRTSSEEWHDIAEKVSKGSEIEITANQCRNRLDTLKKHHKKEKSKFAERKSFSSKWLYFKKMDMYLSLSNQANGYGSETLKTHINPNASDEMRDSLEKDESDQLDNLPTKRRRMGRVKGNRDSLKLLADSINRFTDVYEKVEATKSKQLLELETMRMDFRRDSVSEMWKVLERAQVEIAKNDIGT